MIRKEYNLVRAWNWKIVNDLFWRTSFMFFVCTRRFDFAKKKDFFFEGFPKSKVHHWLITKAQELVLHWVHYQNLSFAENRKCHLRRHIRRSFGLNWYFNSVLSSKSKLTKKVSIKQKREQIMPRVILKRLTFNFFFYPEILSPKLPVSSNLWFWVFRF